MAKGKKRAAAKKYAKAAAGFSWARAKSHGYPAAAGALASYAVPMLASHSTTVKSKWYGGPLALFAGSLFLKDGKTAHGLAGAAGMLGGMNKQLADFQNGKSQTSPVGWFADNPQPGSQQLPAQPATNAQGRVEPGDDASMLYDGAALQ